MMETVSFPLQALPVELLIHICDLLHGLDRPSFYALRRANKVLRLDCSSFSIPHHYFYRLRIMPKFRIYTVNRPRGVDRHELAAVTSPSLSHISAEINSTKGWNHVWHRLQGENAAQTSHGPNGLPEYQDAALDKILRLCMAPKLTWLRVAENRDLERWFYKLPRHQQHAAPLWKQPPEFLGNRNNISCNGRMEMEPDIHMLSQGTKLEYLELGGQEYAQLRPSDLWWKLQPHWPLRRVLELESMLEWRVRVDFTCLKTLNLIRPPLEDALACLMPSSLSSTDRSSPSNPLPNLTSLTIADRPFGLGPSSDYVPFIASLPKLEHLRMIGWRFNQKGVSIRSHSLLAAGGHAQDSKLYYFNPGAHRREKRSAM